MINSWTLYSQSYLISLGLFPWRTVLFPQKDMFIEPSNLHPRVHKETNGQQIKQTDNKFAKWNVFKVLPVTVLELDLLSLNGVKNNFTPRYVKLVTS